MTVRAALALALPLAAPAPAAAAEPTRFEPLWVDPVSAAGEDRTDCRTMALLNLPPAWQMGDAAAVVLSLRGAPEAPGPPLTAALLDQGAAVLELATGGACGDGSPEAREALADLHGALRAVHKAAGAGLVVAIGLGDAGPAALAAADESRAGAGGVDRLGPEGPRFTATGALGAGGAAAFARGRLPAPRERWDLRGPLLCGALEGVAAGLGGEAGAAGAACLAALVPDPPLAQAAAVRAPSRSGGAR